MNIDDVTGGQRQFNAIIYILESPNLVAIKDINKKQMRKTKNVKENLLEYLGICEVNNSTHMENLSLKVRVNFH